MQFHVNGNLTLTSLLNEASTTNLCDERNQEEKFFCKFLTMKKNILVALLILSNAATGFVAYQQNKNAENYARIAEESQKVAALHLQAATRAMEEAALQRTLAEQQQ